MHRVICYLLCRYFQYFISQHMGENSKKISLVEKQPGICTDLNKNCSLFAMCKAAKYY